MDTNGRGKKCLGLALNRAPLSDLATKETYKNGWNKVTRFLGNLKSPGELRKMSDLEMKEYEKENIYGPTEVADHSLNLCSTEKNLSIKKKNRSSGHVSFGSLGFMNLTEVTDENINNSYRDDIDGDDRIEPNDELDLNDKSDNVSKNVENSEQGPLQISEHENLQISGPQMENELTPAPRDSNKRKRVFGSTSGGQKKRGITSTKNIRIDLSKKLKEKQSVKKSKVAGNFFLKQLPYNQVQAVLSSAKGWGSA